MSASVYRERIGGVLGKIWETQMGNIEKASEAMAETIAKGGLVHMFGSGHSVLPVQDMFPRYGAFPGFRPLMDMRLMWTNVIGSGGAKGLLWLERREGYAQLLFENEPIREGDVMLVFSHGGLNAAGIEVLMEAKNRGLTTVGVTSMDNYRKREAMHSSRKKLADVADIVIDNCTPTEDALVPIEGWKAPVAAGSTVACITIGDFEYRRGIDHRTLICTAVKDYLLQWDIAGLSKQAIETAVSTLNSMTPLPPPPHEPAEPSGAAKRVQVAQGISAGLLIKKVQPIYPVDARYAGIQGTVRLNAVINKNGDIADLEVLDGPIELVVSAVNAVRKWKYRPYLLMGNPVDVQTEIMVNYVLSGR